jgi:hypothetical protein
MYSLFSSIACDPRRVDAWREKRGTWGWLIGGGKDEGTSGEEEHRRWWVIAPISPYAIAPISPHVASPISLGPVPPSPLHERRGAGPWWWRRSRTGFIVIIARDHIRTVVKEEELRRREPVIRCLLAALLWRPAWSTRKIWL